MLSVKRTANCAKHDNLALCFSRKGSQIRQESKDYAPTVCLPVQTETLMRRTKMEEEAAEESGIVWPGTCIAHVHAFRCYVGGIYHVCVSSNVQHS